MTNNKSNYVSILLRWGFVFIIMLLASEIIGHVYRKTPEYKTFTNYYKFVLVRTKALFGYGLTYEDFYSLIEDRLINNQEYYSNMIKLGYRFPQEKHDEKNDICDENCMAYIWQSTNHNYDKWKAWDNGHWAQWFYGLGVTSASNDNLQTASIMLHFARSLAPEWSYFHIELANQLFANNQASEAINVLSECLLFNAAQSYCQAMLDQKIWEKNQPIGFLSEQIYNNIPYPTKEE